MQFSIESFEAIVVEQPKFLILGSMPSRCSLAVQEYYAHPYNAFWPILAKVFGREWGLGQHQKVPFAEKRALLESAKIALWDVLAACQRENSADSSIREVSLNPITELLEQYPSIERILLNGQKSSTLLRQKLPSESRLHALPSTSPAYAGMPFIQKLRIWSQALTLE